MYRARDVLLGRDVAIKVLPAFAAWTLEPARPSRSSRKPAPSQRSNHPNIIAIYDVGKDAGGPAPISSRS